MPSLASRTSARRGYSAAWSFCCWSSLAQCSGSLCSRTSSSDSTSNITGQTSSQRKCLRFDFYRELGARLWYRSTDNYFNMYAPTSTSSIANFCFYRFIYSLPLHTKHHPSHILYHNIIPSTSFPTFSVLFLPLQRFTASYF